MVLETYMVFVIRVVWFKRSFRGELHLNYPIEAC